MLLTTNCNTIMWYYVIILIINIVWSYDTYDVVRIYTCNTVRTSWYIPSLCTLVVEIEFSFTITQRVSDVTDHVTRREAADRWYFRDTDFSTELVVFIILPSTLHEEVYCQTPRVFFTVFVPAALITCILYNNKKKMTIIYFLSLCVCTSKNSSRYKCCSTKLQFILTWSLQQLIKKLLFLQFP